MGLTGRRLRAVVLRVATAAGLLVAALVACSGPRLAVADAAHRPEAPEASAPPVGERTGCGRSAVVGSQELMPMVAGRRRVVRVYVPPGYTGDKAVPLVLDLHGTGSSAVKQEAASRMDGTAEAHTFIVAYPQGARLAKTGYAWNVPGVPDPGGVLPGGRPDDVAFLEQLVSVLRRRYCVDPAAVYGTGFSGGARMISSVACDPGNPFAAIAPVSGVRSPLPCGSAPVAVVAVHGTADGLDPYAGHGGGYWTYSVPTAVGRWAGHDGCAGVPATTRPYPGVTMTAYRSCRAGAAVQLYTLAGGKHQWPAAPPTPRSADPVSAGRPAAFDVNEVLWDFLASHRR